LNLVGFLRIVERKKGTEGRRKRRKKKKKRVNARKRCFVLAPSFRRCGREEETFPEKGGEKEEKGDALDSALLSDCAGGLVQGEKKGHLKGGRKKRK